MNFTKKYLNDLTYKIKGILFNFHCVNIFKEGQKTLVNDLFHNSLMNKNYVISIVFYVPMWFNNSTVFTETNLIIYYKVVSS